MAYPNNNKTLECYRGDIFYVANSGWCVGSKQRGGRPAIIVSNDMANKHSPNVSIVYLTSQEKKPLPTHVEVICKVPSTALCENIQTVSKDRLTDFVKSCTTSEMERVDKAICHALGLAIPAEEPFITEEDIKKLKEAPLQIMPVEPTAVEVERNLYKNLYEQLLDRLTGKSA